MKKIRLSLLFLFSVCVSNAQLNIISPTLETKRGAEGKFKFETLVYDFGKVKQGEPVEYEFKFVNVGKSPISITDARGSCHCTAPTWSKEPVKKGKSGKIKVHFDSTGKSGVQDKTVTVTSNGLPNPVVLHLKGTVVVKNDVK